VPAILLTYLCCNCLLINVLYFVFWGGLPIIHQDKTTIRLIVATHQVTTQFERRPYSIQSYLINPGLIKWIKAVITHTHNFIHQSMADTKYRYIQTKINRCKVILTTINWMKVKFYNSFIYNSFIKWFYNPKKAHPCVISRLLSYRA